MSRHTYEAVAVRSGDWWAIDVPQIRGVHTQARRLDQVEGVTREAIALVLDVPDDSFDVEVKPQLSGDAASDVAAAVEARKALEDAQAQTRRAVDRAAHRLRDAGLPVRDIGRLLGVSHQRAAQIVADAPRAGRVDTRSKTSSRTVAHRPGPSVKRTTTKGAG